MPNFLHDHGQDRRDAFTTNKSNEARSNELVSNPQESHAVYRDLGVNVGLKHS